MIQSMDDIIQIFYRRVIRQEISQKIAKKELVIY